MQDICNTKEDWKLLGLLLNVETINPELNPDYHQYFNIQGVEIDHEIPCIECLVNYLKRFPAELMALTNQTIWTNLRRYFVLDSYIIDEDHVSSGIFMFQRLKIRIQKILEHNSEEIAKQMIATLNLYISNYEEYCEWKMAMALYVTLHERASCISYGSIDQHISDEWVRRQMKLIRETCHEYPRGLVDTFLAAEQSLLLCSGLSYKSESLRDQVEFVFKKGPLHQPSLMVSLYYVHDEQLAEEIRLTRRDERIQGTYPHNLAYRTGRHDDKAESIWQDLRNANIHLQHKLRPISGAREVSSREAMYSPGDPPFSTSAQGTVENTRVVQSAYASDESEGSEPESDSDDESIETMLRAGKVPRGIRQGKGDSVELGPGIFSPTMPKFTSIKTRQPSDSKYGDRRCIVMFRDEQTGEQYYIQRLQMLLNHLPRNVAKELRSRTTLRGQDLREGRCTIPQGSLQAFGICAYGRSWIRRPAHQAAGCRSWRHVTTFLPKYYHYYPS
jgi:hypothetical protein